MNVTMLSQTTKAMNGKGFRSVVQRPGASRASRVTLRTRQRRARAVVVFSSDSEGKETVAAVETKEPVEDIKIKSESEEVEATTAPETNEAETNGAVQVTKAVKSEEKKKKKKNTYNDPLLSVFKVDAPGVATKKRDPNYERKKMGVEPDAWNIVFKELTDAGLKSVSAKEASDLVGGSNAVMVDARTSDMHLKISTSPSVNVSYLEKSKPGKRLFFDRKAVAKNASFLEEAEAVLGSNAKGKTIIVYCYNGGTIKNTITRKDGSVIEDALRPGLDSVSLRAANELIKAGYTNVLHLEGGVSAWEAEGLPTKVSEKWNKKRRADDPKAWPNVHASLVAAGIDSVDAAGASTLAGSGEAVIVDVGSAKKFEKEHIPSSISVPFVINDNCETNPNFVEAFKRDVGDKKVIVTCLSGGTLSTERLMDNGRVFKDPQLKNGKESESLRAISELLNAGYKNIVHLDGGNSSWKGQKLPMNGSALKGIIEEGPAGWRVDVLSDDQDKDIWRRATVTSYNEASGMFKVKYDDLGEDGNEVEVSLDQNRTKWLSR